MKLFNFFKKSKYAVISTFLIVTLFILPYNMILADSMQSSTYKIQSDSLNIGGVDSSSAGYNLNDTLGEVSTGDSNSTNYYMHAGYWQMQETSISISTPLDLTLASMGGLSGGSSEGSASWLIVTDNTAGYNMTIKSSTSPTLKSAVDSFADYVPLGGDPDYNFSIPSSDSAFGFSPEGTDIISRFKDNGSICNTGLLDSVGKCWDGLSTTPKLVSGSTTSNMPSGGSTSIKFRAESGSSHIQTSGTYSATITATALTL